MSRITSKQAKELKEAYASVHNLAEETARERMQRRKEEIKNPFGNTTIQTQDGKELKQGDPGFQDALKKARETVRNANNKSLGNQSTNNNQQSTQRPVPQNNNQQSTQKPVAQAQTRPAPQAQAAPQTRPAPQAQPAPQTRPAPQAQPQAQPGRTVGAPQSAGRPGSMIPVQDRTQAAVQKPGALSRLGSLAGRAAGAARNAASRVKQVATSAVSNIKKGVQSVGSALQNKGPIQGRQTGAQRRAQQTSQPVAKPQPTAQPTAQPVAKPVLSNNSPAAKAGIPLSMRQAAADKNAKFQAARKSGNLAQYRKDNPKMSGADRAKAMARERIAAKKAAATPINSSYDLFDDTVQFLVSEGHAKDVSEAMSIMSESEFIDAFNQELNG